MSDTFLSNALDSRRYLLEIAIDKHTPFKTLAEQQDWDPAGKEVLGHWTDLQTLLGIDTSTSKATL